MLLFLAKSNICSNVTFTEELFFYGTQSETKVSTLKHTHVQIGQFIKSDQY